ncbi:hypothetical protein GPECTOR_34g749 [Gonium pectorale]|uniref:Uncharacterized protein n=1 Tax=Gonium pectorale TaxID=33097 RepID=A0A150GE14_GONPE|nr:hypothetical protein GPECTOR_34g749 [Gonium pectorale]|eukprot:KXZ47590.1 hypothetical protein GPECTOR_34g749 [Gonium pectorale]
MHGSAAPPLLLLLQQRAADGEYDEHYDDEDDPYGSYLPYMYRTAPDGLLDTDRGAVRDTFFGALSAQLLALVNKLGAAVPQLGSLANATTGASGAQTAQRRNATTRLQLEPNRTGGLYNAGSAALDPANVSVLAAGYSASVVKDVATAGAPTANFGSAGQSLAVGRSSTTGTEGGTGGQALTGGLSLAGAQAVPVRVTFTTGPVTTIFEGDRRTGSSSQNGVAAEGTGQTSDLTLLSASLATYSTSANQSAAQQAALLAQQALENADAVALLAESRAADLARLRTIQLAQRAQRLEKQGRKEEAGRVWEKLEEARAKPPPLPPAPPPPPRPPLPARPGDGRGGRRPGKAKSGGAAVTMRLTHNDTPGEVSAVPLNSVGTIRTFGASNLFGWTRGAAFGTGAASTTTFVAGATKLEEVACLAKSKQPRDGRDPPGQGAGQGQAAGDVRAGGGGGGGDALADLLRSVAVAPLPGNSILSASQTAGVVAAGLERSGGGAGGDGRSSGGVLAPSEEDCRAAQQQRAAPQPGAGR